MIHTLRGLLFGALVAFMASGAAPAATLANRLAGHASPYLAMHGRDPVAWQEWNAETLARARRENKLLLVSVGYFSCHWCHVMQKESYRDPAIAALLNEHFIPVKVDRELNAGLDNALLDFATRLKGVSGWPLNAFVTPDGYPAHAVLYMPAEDFKGLLKRLVAAWRDRGDEFRRAARDAAPPPAEARAQKPDADTRQRQLQAYLAAVWHNADTLQGGYSRVAKFPMAPHMARLIDIHGRERDRRLGDFLRLSLDQMARLGLRDHVNGGFFRYTVDPDWRTPHFEKMLADNAQLASVYASAARALDRPEYLGIAHETLDFMLDALAAPGGGYYTATSALDRRDREGGAYLWTKPELKKRLSVQEFALATRIWKLDAAAPFDLGYLPVEHVEPTPEERARLREILRKLKAAGRQGQVPVDTKIGAGLNGLALSALTRAGRGVPRYEKAARELAAFLRERMVKRGEMLKTLAGGRAFDSAELDDHAYVIAGLLDYGDAFGDPAATRLARDLAARAWARFFGQQGWRREARPLLASMTPEPALEDGALPSASAMLIAATRRMTRTQPDKDLASALDRALALAVPAMAQAPFEHPSGLDILAIATDPATVK